VDVDLVNLEVYNGCNRLLEVCDLWMLVAVGWWDVLPLTDRNCVSLMILIGSGLNVFAWMLDICRLVVLFSPCYTLHSVRICLIVIGAL